MNIKIVSEDDFLPALCLELAGEFPSITWAIERRTDSSKTAEADLCLWDYKADLPLPEKAKWATKCFAFVSPCDLISFRAAHPYAGSAILLKPPTRVVIRALMAQTVRNATQYAQNYNSVQSDRDDILQRLTETNLQLQQNDFECANFLGRTLHDFHAPLTALGGYCGLLVEERIGLLNDQQKTIINRMHRSVRRLSRMSAAMFQISVGRHVLLKPSLRKGDIRDCAEQARFEVQQLAAEKQLQLDINLDLPCGRLLIDSDQIEQVIVNLLENACKFSPRSGSIVVQGYSCFFDRRATNVLCPVAVDRRGTSEGTPNVYRIDIRDSGPGIAPEHLKSIFEEYVSYAGIQNRSRAGLGLAICRRILSQHYGRIWAANGRSGAVFSLFLPLHYAENTREADEATYDTTPRELFTPRV